MIKWVKWVKVSIFSNFRIFCILLFYYLCIFCIYIVFALRGCLCMVLPGWFASLKMSIFYTTILGAKIRYFKESNQFWKPIHIHIIIYLVIQNSKLQSTLLHQRFICYWHIELVDIVEIYIAPTFHIILQSL